jgi:uncharacterized membrane protein (UPF0127 family)
LVLPPTRLSPSSFDTGEHRLVDTRAPVEQHAVGRDRLAQRDAHSLAGAQVQHADRLDAAAIEQPLGLLRHALECVFQRLRGAVPRMQLEKTRRQQEADEHRHRVEIDLMAEDAAGVEGGTRAGHEGHADAERDRHVHADAALAQAAPHAAEKRPGRKQQHRQAQHPAAPVEQLRQIGAQFARPRHVRRRGQHHHLHHAEGGDEQPPQRLAALRASQLARRRRRVGRSVVARAAHRVDEQRRPRFRRVPAHRGTLAGGADAGLADAVDAEQRVLDDAGTGGAVHARQLQCGIRDAPAIGAGRPAREALLFERVVEHRRVRRGVAHGRGGGGDGARHREAALSRCLRREDDRQFAVLSERPYMSPLSPLRCALGVFVALALAGAASAQSEAQPRLDTVTLHAGMHNSRAEVARTPLQRQTGMMFRKAMAQHEGMLFVFDGASQLCFWMKNTLLPLSIAFVADDGSIVDIAEMQPQSEATHCSSKPVRFALEMNQGWFAKRGIQPGFKLKGAPFGS